VAEREASGDFDYLWDDPADVGGLTSDDQTPEAPGDDPLDERDDSVWDSQPDSDDTGHFDAFNMNTWSFTSPPMPWYRTKQALTAIIAAAAAMAAIVVSGVLLVFRGPSSTVDEGTSSVTPTAPPSAATVQAETSAEPPPPLPPPPPPPPPETVGSPVNTAPRNNPTYQPRPTKAPEIGVTRTPVTRSPISVAPQPRTPHTGNR
jgi:hypothetical protein